MVFIDLESLINEVQEDPFASLAANVLLGLNIAFPKERAEADLAGKVMLSIWEDDKASYLKCVEVITKRVLADLLPIARECYYNPSQNGSWSLKAVAPAIAPELSYDNLEGVHVGSEAGIAYIEACKPETSPQRREELRRQMLAYCELDTLATVHIWQLFKGISW